MHALHDDLSAANDLKSSFLGISASCLRIALVIPVQVLIGKRVYSSLHFCPLRNLAVDRKKKDGITENHGPLSKSRFEHDGDKPAQRS